ncbi:MAG: hypothetical protein ABL925_16840 [Methylococcales bacterium]
MKIHSSSLTFSPIGVNRHNLDKNDSALQNDPKAAPTKTKQTQSSSPAEIEKIYADADLQQHSVVIANKPTDPRTLKALNAYILELNQPLQDRTSQLITGIDTYV